MANCYFGFGHVFKVPVVVASLLQFLWYDEILGNPMSTAYTASYDTESSRVVTFWDRVKNHFRAHYNNYRIFKGTEEYQTEAMRKYLSPDIPNIRQVEKQVALQLLNTYHSFHGIRPFIPAVVQVGGIEIEQSEAKITPVSNYNYNHKDMILNYLEHPLQLFVTLLVLLHRFLVLENATH